MDDFPIETKFIRDTVALLEKHSYGKVREYLADLSRDELLLQFFWLKVYDLTFFNRISNHKIKLAKILANRTRVKAYPEDRTRIVFTLANYTDSDLKTINQAFSNEFGPAFKIYENYNIGATVKNLRELALRAREIQNGYHNYDLLCVQNTVTEIINFYKIFSITDVNKLREIIELGKEILVAFSSQFADIRFNKEIEKMIPKVKEFYRISNRVKIDIEAVDMDMSIDGISQFISKVLCVCNTRIYLINNSMPLDNLEQVEAILLEKFAERNLFDHTSIEELDRIGKPLQPIP